MSEETRDFFKTYTDFVTKVTSDPSLDLDALKERLDEIESLKEIIFKISKSNIPINCSC